MEHDFLVNFMEHDFLVNFMENHFIQIIVMENRFSYDFNFWNYPVKNFIKNLVLIINHIIIKYFLILNSIVFNFLLKNFKMHA